METPYQKSICKKEGVPKSRSSVHASVPLTLLGSSVCLAFGEASLENPPAETGSSTDNCCLGTGILDKENDEEGGLSGVFGLEVVVPYVFSGVFGLVVVLFVPYVLVDGVEDENRLLELG